MPTSAHKYSIEDLLAALLRDQGIHEGHWALNVEFTATGASVKPQDNPARTLPGLIVSLNSATLLRADASAAGAVDAAVANPRKDAPRAKPVRSRKPASTTLQ
ncbi:MULTISPECIES: hypothetical protein [Paraburkholderia]|uniref:Uncharacterized protein n=1 Tax=Paraburkholderia fynbosensis TaxID=1200993 RepID=A0A6J5GKB2_9BURK|nr:MULTISPECIES: hypothetical protein [Paraburkholderia]RKT20577.1 hypothetical protein B0G69_3896 [Paraburkholderia sp. RAU2J]CAB3800910.1 hypothetical protein LMG27177_04913 [Paraburkholderia fynbosensis]